ncbi:acylneuraminate cytidylyltransferase family protein [Ferrovibrio terrae]|uniref:acylneuraminate cytidylyltransferase family protein n=1 Tax=Ferrovibrio terrae TaxID=2594003 RepID=UPI00313808EE
MKAIAFIFARGGSKGIPRKNLSLLDGKPLLAWAIDSARSCPSVGRVIVSTDDDEIASMGRQFGAEVPFIRPSYLAQDGSPEWLAWRHAVNFVQTSDGPFDTFLAVPTTSPLRSPEDLERCIAKIQTGCDAVVTVTEANRNPYFNMVRFDEDGCVKIAVETGRIIANRQDAPPVYDLTTVAYAVKPQLIMTANDIFDGRVKAVVVPRERSLDIDTPFDLQFAEFIVKTTRPPASPSATIGL